MRAISSWFVLRLVRVAYSLCIFSRIKYSIDYLSIESSQVLVLVELVDIKLEC